MQWWIGSGSLDLEKPVFLGILNITPDSFSDGGLHLEPTAALTQASRLLRDGADLLDLGAESTRPGASSITPESEWARLQPVLTGLKASLPKVPLSLDTRHAEVARQGLALNIAILNDITGFSDPLMLDLARQTACGLIAMRSRVVDGRLFMPEYGSEGEASAHSAIGEMKEIKDRLIEAGIDPERILLDPGFGFGTTFREDSALWKSLPDLPRALDWPAQRICIGISRKRFLAWRAGAKTLAPGQRDELTQEAHEEAKSWGYRVFRTHEVKELCGRDEKWN
jgi:dihydropteroate synthase